MFLRMGFLAALIAAPLLPSLLAPCIGTTADDRLVRGFGPLPGAVAVHASALTLDAPPPGP